MKRWRRPLILIALLLLVGAVVNVGVAWVAAWAAPRYDWAARGRGFSGSVAQTGGAFRSVARHTFPLHERVAISSEPPRWILIQPAPGAASAPEHSWALYSHRVTDTPLPWWAGDVPATDASWLIGCGWPARSLCAWEHRTNGRTAYDGALILFRRGSAQAPLFEDRHAAYLPVRPLLAGFAINTLFYAAILALPLSVFPVRRRLRARRGRCPKCGYDLAGLGGVAGDGGEAGVEWGGEGGDGGARCPECGATR